MKKCTISCLALFVLLAAGRLFAAGTAVTIAFDQLLTDAIADGAPTLNVSTNFFLAPNDLSFEMYCEAGTNVTANPTTPVFLADSTFRLVLMGLAVENSDPNRFERNDAMKFTVTIRDEGNNDVTADYITKLNMISINDRSDGITNVTIYALGDSVSYEPNATTTQGRELPFGPVTVNQPIVMTTDNKDPAGGPSLDALLHIRRLQFDVTVVPEPGIFAIIGIAGAVLFLRRR
jgi:hypothetical protein